MKTIYLQCNSLISKDYIDCGLVLTSCLTLNEAVEHYFYNYLNENQNENNIYIIETYDYENKNKLTFLKSKNNPATLIKE